MRAKWALIPFVLLATAGAAIAGVDLSVGDITFTPVGPTLVAIDVQVGLVQTDDALPYDYSVRLEWWRNGQLISVLFDYGAHTMSQTTCPLTGYCSGDCTVVINGRDTDGKCKLKTLTVDCLCHVNYTCPKIAAPLLTGDNVVMSVWPVGLTDDQPNDNVKIAGYN